MDRLKVGIVGCGTVAEKRHAPSYAFNKGCRLAAVMTTKLDRAMAFSKRFGIPRYYDSLDNFLSEHLDIVSICTPPSTHASIAISCLRNRSNVLIEKPMAMNVREAVAMKDEAEKQALKLSVCHNMIFSHSISFLDELGRRGKLGSIRSVWVLRTSNMKRAMPGWILTLPGGVFFDELPHMLYLLRHLLPDLEVRNVVASSDRVSRQKPGRIGVSLEGGEARSALIAADYGCSRDEWLMYVIAEKATAKVDLFKDTVVLSGGTSGHHPFDVLKASVNEVVQEIGQLFSAGLRYSFGRQYYGHDKLIRLFVSSVANGADSPVAVEEGLAVVQLQESIVKSMIVG